MLGREIVPRKLGAKLPPYPSLIGHGQFQFAFPLLPLPNSGSFQEIPTNTCDFQTLAPFFPACAKLLWENVGRKKGAANDPGEEGGKRGKSKMNGGEFSRCLD